MTEEDKALQSTLSIIQQQFDNQSSIEPNYPEMDNEGMAHRRAIDRYKHYKEKAEGMHKSQGAVLDYIINGLIEDLADHIYNDLEREK